MSKKASKKKASKPAKVKGSGVMDDDGNEIPLRSHAPHESQAQRQNRLRAQHMSAALDNLNVA